jgi:acrylyl-CoA reductase (NADPH)
MTFRAFRIADDKAPGRLVDAAIDELTAGDVVIDVAYSSVNYKDALAGTATGKILRKFPLVGGIDLAGTVRSSADGRFREGQPVVATGYDLGVAHDGGYAAVARVPADWVVPLPANLDLFESMAIGTAGFTAGLSIVELEHNGLKPGSGPVIVTGATGGVGSLAVSCLSRLGYKVTALTGKDGEHAFLRSLGAAEVVSRAGLQMGTRPLEKATWAGAVDAVGGDVLAWLTRTMNYGGAIANSGLTAGTDLHTTVLPFILRGVRLIGIDSVMCSMARRLEVWRRLATDMKPPQLRKIATEIRLEDLPTAFDTLLKGRARGRFVVKVN